MVGDPQKAIENVRLKEQGRALPCARFRSVGTVTLLRPGEKAKVPPHSQLTESLPITTNPLVVVDADRIGTFVICDKTIKTGSI
jgi:hypothetical protein